MIFRVKRHYFWLIQWFLSVSEVQKWAIYRVGGWKTVKNGQNFFWFNTIMTFKWFLGLKDIISDSFNDFRVWARYKSEQCKKIRLYTLCVSFCSIFQIISRYLPLSFNLSVSEVQKWAMLKKWARYKIEQCQKVIKSNLGLHAHHFRAFFKSSHDIVTLV